MTIKPRVGWDDPSKPVTPVRYLPTRRYQPFYRSARVPRGRPEPPVRVGSWLTSIVRSDESCDGLLPVCRSYSGKEIHA